MTESNTEGARDKARRSRDAAIQVGRLSRTLFRHFVSWRLMRFSLVLPPFVQGRETSHTDRFALRLSAASRTRTRAVPDK